MSHRLIVLLAGLAFASPSPMAMAQDAAAGQRAFNQCRACHQVGEKARHLVGPHLNGLFGRKAGTIEGYNFSPAMAKSGIVWTEESFARYIRDPRAQMPGTKMIFVGLKDDQRIGDLIAYLKQFGPDGKPAAAQ